MENQIRNTSGDEPIGLNDELIWNIEEEKNQDFTFRPLARGSGWVLVLSSEKGLRWRRPDLVDVNGSQGR